MRFKKLSVIKAISSNEVNDIRVSEDTMKVANEDFKEAKAVKKAIDLVKIKEEIKGSSVEYRSKKCIETSSSGGVGPPHYSNIIIF